MYFILLILCFTAISCSSSGSSGDDSSETTFDPFLNDSDYYKPGDSVRGGDFSFIEIEVDAYIWDARKREYIKIEDGTYLTPGTYKLGIRTDPRRDPSVLTTTYTGLGDLIEGDIMDQRVYASDGGNSYLVEALLDAENGLYVCDINVDGVYPVYPLLIEVLYSDGMAKKEKIVLSTRKSLRAPANKLVKWGMALSMDSDFAHDLIYWAARDQDMLISLLKVVRSLLCERRTNWIYAVETVAKIDFLFDYIVPFLLAIGDVTPGASDGSLARVHLRGLPILATVGIGLEDRLEDGDVVEGPLDIEFPISAITMNLNFIDEIVQRVVNFFLSLMSEPVSLNLDSVLEPVWPDLTDILNETLDVKLDNVEDYANELYENILPLNMTAFVHAFARPEENTRDIITGFASAFLCDTKKLPTKEELGMDRRCFPDWPKNTICDASVGLDITPIKKKGMDIGLAVSGYLINSLASQVANIYEIVMPPTITNIALVLVSGLDDTVSSALTGTIKLNPHGVTAEFYDSDDVVKGVLMANDVVMTLLDNGAPVSVANIDVAFDIWISTHWDEEQDWIVDVELSVNTELSHIHIIDDQIGLVFLDHSAFLKSLIDTIFLGTPSNAPQTIKWQLNISEILGVHPLENDGTHLSSEDGNIYITLSLDHKNIVDYSVLGYWIESMFGVDSYGD